MSEPMQKRSFVLVLAAMLANLYLLAFSIDALLSVIEEIFRGLTASLALSALRTLFAGVAVLASALMIPVLVFIPQLPKRAFVPLILFAFWGAVGAPPINLADAGFAVSLLLVLGQVALAGLAYSLIKKQTGRYWLTAVRLPVRSQLVLRIGASAVVVVLGVFFVLPFLLLSGLRATAEVETAGYVRFSDAGVEVADRIFRKGDQAVRLVGMVHIGEANFYADLFDSFPTGSLVLAEGVSDNNKLLEGNLSYKRVAQVLGLDQQPALRSAASTPDAVAKTQSRSSVPNRESDDVLPPDVSLQQRSLEGPEIVSADIDLSEFSPTTIGFLNETAALYDSPSFAIAWQRLQTLNMNYPEPSVDVILEDIVDKRNDKVLAEFDIRQATYDEIIIPWGALHMPGIEAAITSRGYELESEQYRPLIRYDTLIKRLRTFRQRANG